VPGKPVGLAGPRAFFSLAVAASTLALSCGRSDLGLPGALEGAGSFESGGTGGLGPSSGGASSGARPGTGGSSFGGSSSGGTGGGVSLGGSGGSTLGGTGGGSSGGSAGNGVAGTGVAGAASGASGNGGVPPAFQLVGVPLTFAPTPRGFGLNAVLSAGDPGALVLSLRVLGETTWRRVTTFPTFPASDTAQWELQGLNAGTRYEYLLSAENGDTETALYVGSVLTTPPPGTPFTAALLTDTHIQPREVPPGDVTTSGSMEDTLAVVAPEIAAVKPDFMLNLGDILDFHAFGFNDPPPDASWARLAYLNYRRLLSTSLGNTPHFGVIGNWDGESGCNTEEEIERSRSQRLIYEPNPGPETYPEGGSVNQDYYAFTWGDALFVVLNVMTYTPTCHLLSTYPGLPDDWTLGDAQLEWLRTTLKSSTSKWRFTFIHHTVGGKAGNDEDSAYGRGGGQAAYVGEQAIIHQMLLDYGVQIFFYAHDHVFTDMTVDGVHYTLPGSAGAPWKFTSEETGYAKYWPDSGFARLDVSPEAVKVSFVGDGGAVLDEINLP
jgi:hypothetical protein